MQNLIEEEILQLYVRYFAFKSALWGSEIAGKQSGFYRSCRNFRVFYFVKNISSIHTFDDVNRINWDALNRLYKNRNVLRSLHLA